MITEPQDLKSRLPLTGWAVRALFRWRLVYQWRRQRSLVCAELRIEAETRDAQNRAWGRLLHWYDRDGVLHTWAMPDELMYGEPADVLRELASRGLTIAPGRKAKELLLAYLQASATLSRARCVDRLGWHGELYCTPEGTIGVGAGERVIFQSAGAIQPEYAMAGTVEDWRASVAGLRRETRDWCWPSLPHSRARCWRSREANPAACIWWDHHHPAKRLHSGWRLPYWANRKHSCGSGGPLRTGWKD